LDEEDWLGTRGDDEEEETDEEAETDEEEETDGEETEEEEESDEEEETDELDDANEDAVVMDEEEAEGLQPLHLWENEQLIATRCSNDGAVVEWIVVPFMYEEAPDPLDGEKEEL
jgi:hypothetical protein